MSAVYIHSKDYWALRSYSIFRQCLHTHSLEVIKFSNQISFLQLNITIYPQCTL